MLHEACLFSAPRELVCALTGPFVEKPEFNGHQFPSAPTEKPRQADAPPWNLTFRKKLQGLIKEGMM